MPNDAFFETTGVLQVVSAALAAWYLYRMSQGHGARLTTRIATGGVIAGRALASIQGAFRRMISGPSMNF